MFKSLVYPSHQCIPIELEPYCNTSAVIALTGPIYSKVVCKAPILTHCLQFGHISGFIFYLNVTTLKLNRGSRGAYSTIHIFTRGFMYLFWMSETSLDPTRLSFLQDSRHSLERCINIFAVVSLEDVTSGYIM